MNNFLASAIAVVGVTILQDVALAQDSGDRIVVAETVDMRTGYDVVDRAFEGYVHVIRETQPGWVALSGKKGWLEERYALTFDEARQRFKARLRNDSKGVRAHLALGNMLAQSSSPSPEDVRQAIQHYRDALAVDPSFGPARMNIGTCLHVLGRYDEAIQHFTLMLVEKPDSADLYFNRANAHYRKGDWRSAIADCERSLSRNPDLEKARLIKTDAERRLHAGGQQASLDGPSAVTTEAHAAADTLPLRGEKVVLRHNSQLYLGGSPIGIIPAGTIRAVEAIRDGEFLSLTGVNGWVRRSDVFTLRHAEEVMRGKLKLSPDAPNLHLTLGIFILEASSDHQWKRIEEAGASLTRAIELGSGDTACSARINRANAFRRLRKYDDALDDLSVASESASHRPDCLLLRGMIYLERTQFNEAIQELDAGLKLSPGHPTLQMVRASVTGRQAQYENLIASAKRSIQEGRSDEIGIPLMQAGMLAPGAGCICLYLAQSYVLDKDYDESLKQLDIAHRLWLSKQDKVECYRLAAKCHVELRAYSDAVQALDSAITLAPENVDLIVERSDAALSAKQLIRAVADISTAIRLRPESFDYRLKRARIWEAKQRPDLAINDIKFVITATPNDENARRELKQLYTRVGDLERALDCVAADIKRDGPTTSHLSSAVDLLTLRCDRFLEKRQIEYAIADQKQILALLKYTDIPQHCLRFQKHNNKLARLILSRESYTSTDHNMAVHYASVACTHTSWRHWDLVRTLVATYNTNGKTVRRNQVLEKHNRADEDHIALVLDEIDHISQFREPKALSAVTSY